MIKVKSSSLKKTVEGILTHYGVPIDQASIVSESIIFAHLRGKGTHGVVRLPIYINKIVNGLMSAETKCNIIKESPIISVIDAEHGFGQVAAYKGMLMCMEKAEKYGVGIVGIRNSNNFGTAGFIAELASTKDMIGVVLANSSPAIAPPGGKIPILGTNPLGISFPKGTAEPPIVLDMATSVAARGKIRQAAKNNEKIPFGWALDENGIPTDDPLEALKGSMIPIGEHKGFGLSLAIDIIAGLLTGAAFGGEVKPLNSKDGFSCYGHFIVAINISFFMELEEYKSKMDVLIQNVKNCSNDYPVFLPGEKSYKMQQESDGIISLKETLVSEINSLAQAADIDFSL